MIDTTDLELISRIAQTGTLSAASLVVHLSQPAITRRIQALEARAGVKLFRKNGRRLQLTEAGEEFVRRSNDILGRVHDLEEEIRAFSRGQRGVLRIGATATVCLYLLGPALEEMRRSFPQYELYLVNESSRRMPELVREGAVDVGIASVGSALPGLEVTDWTQLTLGLLGKGGVAQPVSISSLHQAPLVVSSGGSLRAAVEAALARYSVQPRVVAQADSLEVVRMLVGCGFGSAIVPVEVMRQDLSRHGLAVSPFEEEVEPLRVACFYRRIHPPLNAFLSVLM